MSRPFQMFSRMRLAALAVTASLALAGCNGQDGDISARARQPLSPKILTQMSEKDMTPQSPILVRVFKEEAELEVWKTTSNGTYALLKTYPICRWGPANSVPRSRWATGRRRKASTPSRRA